MSRSLALAFCFVPALAFAQTLSQADAALRQAVADAKKTRAPQPVTISCTTGGKNAEVVAGTFDPATLQFTPEGLPTAKPLTAPEGKSFVDERCGALAAPAEDSYNYEVTPDHYWGQNILQLPKSAFAAGAPRSFTANLHICQYDGDWSASDSRAASCEIKTP